MKWGVEIFKKGGGNFAIFWKFRPPFHFIMTPPLYEFSKKFYPPFYFYPLILFLPPHYMQNEYHFFAPERFLWLKATWKYKFTQSSKMLTKNVKSTSYPALINEQSMNIKIKSVNHSGGQIQLFSQLKIVDKFQNKENLYIQTWFVENNSGSPYKNF